MSMAEYYVLLTFEKDRCYFTDSEIQETVNSDTYRFNVIGYFHCLTFKLSPTLPALPYTSRKVSTGPMDCLHSFLEAQQDTATTKPVPFDRRTMHGLICLTETKAHSLRTLLCSQDSESALAIVTVRLCSLLSHAYLPPVLSELESQFGNPEMFWISSLDGADLILITRRSRIKELLTNL